MTVLDFFPWMESHRRLSSFLTIHPLVQGNSMVIKLRPPGSLHVPFSYTPYKKLPSVTVLRTGISRSIFHGGLNTFSFTILSDILYFLRYHTYPVETRDNTFWEISFTPTETRKDLLSTRSLFPKNSF